MVFVPFSPDAKAWELIAIGLRRLANIGEDETPDPEVLAAAVGLCMVDAHFALQNFSEADRDHLLVSQSRSWSGGVYPAPLPDGRYICILNPNHVRRRNRITLMEEVVHVHLRHRPSGLRDIMPGLRLREYHKEHEREAYGVGAAVLLPWAQFYPCLDAGMAVSEMADQFDVTEKLVKYRIGITAATNLYRHRCRRNAAQDRFAAGGAVGGQSSRRGIV